MNEQSPAKLKDQMRREALAQRDALDPAERKAASERIVGRLAELLRETEVGSFSAYMPIRSEVDLTPIFAIADEIGVAMALPAQMPEGLIFRAWRHGEPLVASNFRVREPRPDAHPITPELIVVPMLAFDRDRHRLGYGRGHYDRAIAALLADGIRPLLVGVAFSTQEVAAIPAEPHDVPLDVIVTDVETIGAQASADER